MIVIKQLITPELAKSMLVEGNDINRTPKKPVIDRYAEDMRCGRWKENTGELIKLSKSGKILDGQHRLMAVVKSGTPIHFHVAYDLEESIFDVLDTGSVRSANDVFSINRIKNGSILPSIISLFNVLNSGHISIKSVQKHNRLTNAQVLKLYSSNEEYWQEVTRKTWSWYLKFSKILPMSAIGGIYAFLSTKDSVLAEDFMNQVCTGESVKNHTILLLRNRLMADKISKSKINSYSKNALILKAWNAYRTNKVLKQLKFDEREDMPIAL